MLKMFGKENSDNVDIISSVKFLAKKLKNISRKIYCQSLTSPCCIIFSLMTGDGKDVSSEIGI